LLFLKKGRKKERKKIKGQGAKSKKNERKKAKEMENSFLSFFYSLMPTGLNLQWRKPILWRRIKEKGFCFLKKFLFLFFIFDFFSLFLSILFYFFCLFFSCFFF